jgi:hypothetical protein
MLKALFRNGPNCYMHVEGYKVNMCIMFHGQGTGKLKVV